MFWGNTFWSPSAQLAVSREFMQNYLRPTSMRTLGDQILFILLSHSRAGNRVPDATQSPTLQNHDTLSFLHPEPKAAGPACGHHFYLTLSALAPDRIEKLRPRSTDSQPYYEVFPSNLGFGQNHLLLTP